MAIDEFSKTISTSSEDSLLVRVNGCFLTLEQSIYDDSLVFHIFILNDELLEGNEESRSLRGAALQGIAASQLKDRGLFHDVGEEIYLLLHLDLMHSMLTSLCKAYPHLRRIHHSRIALSLEMEDGPVYVNAKQYNGML
ncbi:nuclear transcription factor Y subunit A-1-like protein isoform X1 [Tanacetum coccineum]